ELFRRGLLELGAPRLERGHVLGRRQRGLALGQQVIAAVAGLHRHEVPDVPEILNAVQQNDLHVFTLVCLHSRLAGTDLPGTASGTRHRHSPRPPAPGTRNRSGPAAVRTPARMPATATFLRPAASARPRDPGARIPQT